MRELVREFVADQQRRREAHNRDMRVIHTLEGLRRSEKLPRLDSLYIKPRRQTPAAMSSVLAELSAQYGIPLRVHRMPTPTHG